MVIRDRLPLQTFHVLHGLMSYRIPLGPHRLRWGGTSSMFLVSGVCEDLDFAVARRRFDESVGKESCVDPSSYRSCPLSSSLPFRGN